MPTLALMPGTPVHPLAIDRAEDHTVASRATLTSRLPANAACALAQINVVIVAARRAALRCASSVNTDLAKQAMIYRRHLPCVHGALRTALDAEFQAVVVVDESSVRVRGVGQVHASRGFQRGRARRHRDPRGFLHRQSFVDTLLRGRFNQTPRNWVLSQHREVWCCQLVKNKARMGTVCT